MLVHILKAMKSLYIYKIYCYIFRLFERDALELSAQFEIWGEDLQTGPLPRSNLEEAERNSRQLDEQVSELR